METTSAAASIDAVSQAQAQQSLSIDQQIDVLQMQLEFFRIDATLVELRYSPRPNERLIAWYEGRRKLLAQQLRGAS